MQLDLKDIFDAQIILDRSIHVKHDVLYNQVLDELKLALTVELAELANATRVFKF
jgi:dimeric dUTPase (all-alpha-NTP-PPase superfamily)